MKRSVLLIGLDKEGKVLLHHKTADAPTNANLWVMIGGSIELGESPEEAMRREVKEELDLTIEPAPFKIYTHEETWGKVERNVFFATIDQPIEELKLVPDEGDGLGFFSKKEMEKLVMNENHRKIINDFFASH